MLKDSVLLFLKGIAMGGADVVPGVSGGTIALITGIYTRLLNAIKSVDKEALSLLVSFKWKELWVKIDGSFLLPLLLGIATSLLTLARVIKYFMEEEPIALWSFFFGLILISALWVLREIRQWHMGTGLALLAGIVIAYLITTLSPAQTPEALWFVFLAGSIAICAMILPGISGAFILLILGKYEFIIEAVNSRDVVTIGVFMLGCLTGLLSFARVVSYTLNKYHDLTIAVLAGFMLGSLNKVWPWKEALSFRINSHGEQVPLVSKNIFPVESAEMIQALLFFALGILLVIVIEKISTLGTRKSAV